MKVSVTSATVILKEIEIIRKALHAAELEIGLTHSAEQEQHLCRFETPRPTKSEDF